MNELKKDCNINDNFTEALSKRFSPGPITYVLEISKKISKISKFVTNKHKYSCCSIS